ncbi:MAG: alpha-L-arabinofuranosidase, partial [Propionibacteriaceae bacterium]|jgi:alpha-N-arabinofuranosidase|nr:alpha-L-arabinofuranosidase [Propionibacteriaceae bacterium]
VADAVVVGSLLISLLRHSDRVTSASLAQLVNVIAPVMTDQGGAAWRQTIFHPFALTSRFARGDVLALDIRSPQYSTAKFGDVDLIDAVATRDKTTGDVAIFLVNRGMEEPVTAQIGVRALQSPTLSEAVVLSNPDWHWQATAADSTSVAPRPATDLRLEAGELEVKLPPVSWVMIRLSSGVES